MFFVTFEEEGGEYLNRKMGSYQVLLFPCTGCNSCGHLSSSRSMSFENSCFESVIDSIEKCQTIKDRNWPRVTIVFPGQHTECQGRGYPYSRCILLHSRPLYINSQGRLYSLADIHCRFLISLQKLGKARTLLVVTWRAINRSDAGEVPMRVHV